MPGWGCAQGILGLGEKSPNADWVLVRLPRGQGT